MLLLRIKYLNSHLRPYLWVIFQNSVTYMIAVIIKNLVFQEIQWIVQTEFIADVHEEILFACTCMYYIIICYTAIIIFC